MASNRGIQQMFILLIKLGLKLLGLGAVVYVLVWAAVWLAQERFIFQPKPLPPAHSYEFSTPFEEITLKAPDSAQLNALYFSARRQPSRGAVLYFHGNRGNLSRWGGMHSPFTSRGYDVLMLDYRGYGKSTGQPTEEGLYEDAATALQWLRQRHALSRILFYGRSLGSGVAAQLAVAHTPRMLLLETPYDAIPSVIRAQVLLPLPDCTFRHQFPTARFLPQVECPVYVFAGTQDRLIPMRIAQRLQPLLNGPGHFFRIEGGGHRNLAAFESYHFHLDCLLSS